MFLFDLGLLSEWNKMFSSVLRCVGEWDKMFLSEVDELVNFLELRGSNDQPQMIREESQIESISWNETLQTFIIEGILRTVKSTSTPICQHCFLMQFSPGR